MLFYDPFSIKTAREAMAAAIAADMDAGAMAAGKKAARKPKPATNGLGSDESDGLQRWCDVPPTAVEADQE